jgi:hypothetical protein
MVLPGFFEFGTQFEGIDATDLFSLNSVLGASIEGQVVRTLNKMRNEWDPDEQWTGYRFVRQAQTFPDVLLARQGAGTFTIAMGIELKGWYLLSKEGVGSFRFQVTPAACSIFDLIMIVPCGSAISCPAPRSRASHGSPRPGMLPNSVTTGGSTYGKQSSHGASSTRLASSRIRPKT